MLGSGGSECSDSRDVGSGNAHVFAISADLWRANVIALTTHAQPSISTGWRRHQGSLSESGFWIPTGRWDTQSMVAMTWQH